MRTNRSFAALVLLTGVLIAGCGSRPSVGALRTDTQSVELGDAESVRVEIEFGAGDLVIGAGASPLLEADFTYNVAQLKPELEYSGGTLTISQPDAKGLPVLQGIGDFRSEWDLRLNSEVPLDLRVDIGAGTGRLNLAGLALTNLDIVLGAGSSTIDLGGDWERDLEVSIDAGAGDVRLRLPHNMGASVEVDGGLTVVDAPGLAKDGNVYTNSAYGKSEATLRVEISSGLGQVILEVEDGETADITVPGAD